MIYVGVLTELLGIAEQEVERALDAQLGKKPKALALNHQAIRAGWEWAHDQLQKRDPFRLERMNETAGKILIDGNTAGALGALLGGVTVVTWYPITPSSSLVEALIGFLEQHRRDADGRATYAVVQAEDEIAAIGMVLGASWTGARAMTSTSGPGISLMAEFVGYGYYAEIPAVIWDIQRIGPSTGLPTRTSQADLLFVHGLSHGDTRHVILLPASVRECYDFGMQAFDLAERLQTPVFVLSDLDLGMNNWMSDPFPYPDQPWDRGKVLSEEEVAALPRFERYRDRDGDGIPYRTLPGLKDPKGAYFTRGSGHDEQARYTEDPEVYQRVMDRLAKKYETAKSLVPAPESDEKGGGEVGLIAYGSTHWAVIETRDQLAASGIPTDYLRVRALPLTESVRRFVQKHARVYVIEQNRDAQMGQLVRLEVGADAGRVRSVLHYNGLPVDARSLTEEILRQEGRQVSPSSAGELKTPAVEEGVSR
jgi:2-oxoglutarate ferredoxin oxidoreductase subunit alpha